MILLTLFRSSVSVGGLDTVCVCVWCGVWCVCVCVCVCGVACVWCGVCVCVQIIRCRIFCLPVCCPKI